MWPWPARAEEGEYAGGPMGTDWLAGESQPLRRTQAGARLGAPRLWRQSGGSVGQAVLDEVGFPQGGDVPPGSPEGGLATGRQPQWP